MNINSAFPSKYLKADDCDEDVTATIKAVKMETVGQGPKAELKPIVFFNELSKGLVLNKTNAKMIAKIAGQDDTDEWVGTKVRLISTEVEFQGDLVMAIRVREVKKAGAAKKKAADPETPIDAPDEDQIPF